MTDYSPNKSTARKTLTAQQQQLLDNIWKCKGDAVAAAKMAGYSDPYAACKALKEEIQEEAEYALARLSTTAVAATEDVLTSEDGVKQASEKLKAASLILERTNPKTEKHEVDVGTKGGIFILPNKRPLDEPEEV
jgi:phage terminase small subunit